MIDHAKLVLAGVIGNKDYGKKNLLYAFQHLQDEHFQVETQRTLFTLLQRYYDMTNGIITREMVVDLLTRNGLDIAKVLLFEELYEEIRSLQVPHHEFKYAVNALRDLRAERLTGEALTVSVEILDRGVEIGKEEKKGHKAAREYLYAQLSEIDKLGSLEIAPEGDMREEGQEMLKEYADRKSGKMQTGIRVGISSVDANFSGFSNGDLSLVCGYTGEGKSQVVCQIAWDAAIMQGKNVFFATSETVRASIRRRILARHSRLPQFDFPGGLNSKDIKNGTLTPRQEEVQNDVISDLNTGTYGKLFITQIPRGGTLSFLEARLNRQAADWKVDLVIIDYLALLRPEVKRAIEREEFTQIIKDAKVLATSHDDGRGVPVISPWAMSQAAWKAALLVNAYGLANLSDTSEAEKSSDVIISLLRKPEEPSEVKLQFLKVRDGDVPVPSTLEVDYRNAYIGDKKSTTSDLFDDDTESLPSFL